jgi:hypothetical protein
MVEEFSGLFESRLHQLTVRTRRLFAAHHISGAASRATDKIVARSI